MTEEEVIDEELEEEIDEELDEAIEEAFEDIDFDELADEIASIETETVIEYDYILDIEVTRIDSVGPRPLEGFPDHDNEEELPRYNEILPDSEAVAGDYHCIQFELENLGDNYFPGGKFENIRAVANMGTSNYSTTYELPELGPQESETIHCHMSILEEGHLTFRFDVVSTDGSPVKVESIGNEDSEMIFSVRVVPRERLQMIMELQNLGGPTDG